jgi:type IV pilus assembly protein PilC
MPKFSYTALDSKGTEKIGTLDAESPAAAISRLREMALFPTAVEEIEASLQDKPAVAPLPSAGRREAPRRPGRAHSPIILSGGVRPKTLCIFTRQLATLVDAGLPLLRGLNVLQRQETNLVLKAALESLSEDLESGSTFSEALYKHPRIFSKLYINMVKAGEVGGVLEVTLTRLAQFMEKAERIKGKVKSAMFYPIAVLVIASAIMSFLMLKIVPKFEDIFRDFFTTESLPGFTQLVLGISRWMSGHFMLIAGCIAGLLIGLKLIAKTERGALLLDRFKLSLPVVGKLIRMTAIARFSRTLGTLLQSGVPILQALQIVKDTSGNRVVAEAIGRVHDSVKEGESIVHPLEASRVFPPMVVSMVDVGENTGALPDMLMKIADVYEDEVDNAISAAVSLLEPVMIIFLAIVVGSIVIALFLPLVELIKRAGQN